MAEGNDPDSVSVAERGALADPELGTENEAISAQLGAA